VGRLGGRLEERARGPARLALSLLLAGLPACALRGAGGPGYGLHVVERGDTVWRISQRYGVAVDEVIRENAITDVRALPVGARLRIPGAGEAGDGAEPSRADRDPPDVASAARGPERGDVLTGSGDEHAPDFGWPVHGPLNSAFGERHSRHHAGVDLGVPGGTPVRAVEAGRVVYSDKLGAYGNVVIVKHAGDWSSVYAHNSRNRVAEGAHVEKGDLLAEVGATGNATVEHLHFELRRGQTAVDPLRYLP
jgi:murein DD-endopeptidase MepM/ murein hydrolase activator NlpD